MEGRQGLALFFTQGISLATWARVGCLAREAAYYRRLGQALGGVVWITYGGQEDQAIAAGLDGIEVLHKPRLCLSWQLAWHYRDRLRRVRILKTNQLPGSLTAVWAKWLTGTRLIVRAGNIYSRNRAREGAGWPERFRLWCQEQLAFWAADRIFLPTEEEVDYVTGIYRVDKSKITVLPNFIQTATFCPDDRIERRPGLVGFVGRFSREKNLFALLEAAAGLPGVTLRLIGSGPQREELEKQAQRLGVGVEFPGNVPNNELPGHLNECEAFAFPSFYEGHPKALLEAMACGLPVVTTPVTGIRNLIRHGETGYLCADTSAPAIRRGLLEVLNDGSLRLRLGRGGRRFVVEHFDTDKVLDIELATYREMGIF
jgi:glycosyltransferase involved in cell wall biosynthesis